LPTFSTASAARILAVATARESTSSQISDNGFSFINMQNQTQFSFIAL